MAQLEVVKGQKPGQRIVLDAEKVCLGRDPECQVVIPITSVSRRHAQILRTGGKYFIEDLQSRNGTFVNSQQVTARIPLKNKDTIRICDFQAVFHDAPFPPLPEGLAKEEPEDDDEPEGSTTIEATVGLSSNMLLENPPAEKLKAWLEISNNLSKTLELESLWPKIVDSLLKLFIKADRCFLILAEEGSGRLLPKVARARRANDEATARFSKSIVKQCLETSAAFLIDDATSDQRIPLSQSVLDFRIRSVMCAPLVTSEGKAFGVIQLDTQDRSKKFTQDDLKFLVGVSNQASIALQNARFHEDQLVREKLKRDMELAHQVQLSFLPRQLPEVAGYEFYAFYEPALDVGGDYYGFVPLANGKLAVSVGDVAGKGVPAALLMAKLSSDARFSLLTQPDLARAVTTLNNLIYANTSEMDRFVTFASAVLDSQTHTVTLVSAGHPSPLLVKSSGLGDAMPREVPGVPLGMLEGFEYEACQVQLAPGECLIFFSDGVPDSYNVRGDVFGNDGIHSTIRAAGSTSAKALGERLAKAVRQHAAGRPPHDDVTLVCVSRSA